MGGWWRGDGSVGGDGNGGEGVKGWWSSVMVVAMGSDGCRGDGWWGCEGYGGDGVWVMERDGDDGGCWRLFAFCVW